MHVDVQFKSNLLYCAVHVDRRFKSNLLCCAVHVEGDENHLLSRDKKFCSEMPVWESRYKLVVTPREFSVFIPIDLTRWNCSHC